MSDGGFNLNLGGEPNFPDDQPEAQEEDVQQQVEEIAEGSEDEPSLNPPKFGSSIASRIQVVSEIPDYVKALVYGPPGQGKTVWACRAPNPLLLDLEHGSRSLRNHPDLVNTVKVLPITQMSDVLGVLWEIIDGHPFYDDIDTLVLDTITEGQKRQMDEQLREGHATSQGRKDQFVPEGKDYQRNTEIMRRMISNFRDLQKNLVVTAHATWDTDENGRRYVRPAITPKLAETFLGIFDVVGYMILQPGQDGQTYRTLQVKGSDEVIAKTRVGGLPPVLAAPEDSDKLSFNMLLDANKEQK